MATELKAVYAAISSVMTDLSSKGIGKNSKNQQQGYAFRGIDDVYNALAPSLAKHRLMMLPEVLSREVTERATKSGGALFYVVLTVNYTLVSAVDGSSHTVTVIGEAMDSADKATNKAMSAAYKYACIQIFCIPTESREDADEPTYDVISREREEIKQAQEYEDWKEENIKMIENAPSLSKLECIYKAAIRSARRRGDDAFEKSVVLQGQKRKEALLKESEKDEDSK